MTYYVYILRSDSKNRYYIGHTNNLENRLKRHNQGKNKSTKQGMPWEIVYKEIFASKQDAYRREFQIKKYKGGEAFKKLITKSSFCRDGGAVNRS